MRMWSVELQHLNYTVENNLRTSLLEIINKLYAVTTKNINNFDNIKRRIDHNVIYIYIYIHTRA